MKKETLILLAIVTIILSACGNNRFEDTLEETTNMKEESHPVSDYPDDGDMALQDRRNSTESDNIESNSDYIQETMRAEEKKDSELIIMKTELLDDATMKYGDVKLEAISLETGQSREIAVFPNCFSTSGSESTIRTFPVVECRNGNYRDLFSEDYTRMAATTYYGSPIIERHCGWIDQNGDFNDITEKFRESFPYSYELVHFPMGFDEDYFYFHASEYTDDSAVSHDVYYRICVEDETGESLERLSLDVYDEINFQEYKAWCEQPDRPQNGNVSFRMTDWLDETHVIGDEINMLVSIDPPELSCESHIVIYDTLSDEISLLIPKEYGMSRNGILSPDGKSAAFLLDPVDGQLEGKGIYIMDLHADEITHVKTDSPEQFANGFYRIDNDRLGPGENVPELSLLEWR